MGLLNLTHKLRLNRLISQAVDDPTLLHDPTWWAEVATAAQGVRELRELETRAMTWLVGKRTYIVAILTGVITALHAAGKLSDSLFQQLLVLLGAGGLAAVRAAISNAGFRF